MSKEVLTERVELKKGEHTYLFDPRKWSEEGVSPVFRVDGVIVAIDDLKALAYEGEPYLICDCLDYQKKIAETGETDKQITCQHTTLIERDFAPHLMKKVLEKIIEEEDPQEVFVCLVNSREATSFPNAAVRVHIGHYYPIQKVDYNSHINPL